MLGDGVEEAERVLLSVFKESRSRKKTPIVPFRVRGRDLLEVAFHAMQKQHRKDGLSSGHYLLLHGGTQGILAIALRCQGVHHLGDGIG
jgi:hypothetical protein